MMKRRMLRNSLAPLTRHYLRSSGTPRMSRLRFALAQHDFPVGAVTANAARVRHLMAEAERHGAAWVTFPEMALSGYPPEDLLLRPSFIKTCAQQLHALAADADGCAAILGCPHQDESGHLYNAA